jgi:hypothetical protein
MTNTCCSCKALKVGQRITYDTGIMCDKARTFVIEIT